MVKIRLAKLDDCKKCEELSRIKELKPATGNYITEEYFKLFVDKDEMFFVAEENNSIVGYVLGEPMKGSMANLGLVAVDKKFRGKSIGKKLIKEFRAKCDKKGLKFILLYAPKFNKKTLEFYRNCKFLEGKEHIQFLDKR